MNTVRYCLKFIERKHVDYICFAYALKRLRDIIIVAIFGCIHCKDSDEAIVFVDTIIFPHYTWLVVNLTHWLVQEEMMTKLSDHQLTNLVLYDLR